MSFGSPFLPIRFWARSQVGGSGSFLFLPQFRLKNDWSAAASVSARATWASSPASTHTP